MAGVELGVGVTVGATERILCYEYYSFPLGHQNDP